MKIFNTPTGNPETCRIEKCDGCKFFENCRKMVLKKNNRNFSMAEAIAEAQRTSLGGIVYDDFHGE